MAVQSKNKQHFIESYNVKDKLDKIVMILGGYEFTVEEIIDLYCSVKVILYIANAEEDRKSPVNRINVENALSILKDFNYLDLLIKSYIPNRPQYHPDKFNNIAELQRWFDTITFRSRDRKSVV